MPDIQQFAIIALSDGPAPPEAIVVGAFSDVMSCLPQTIPRKEAEQILSGLNETLDHIKQFAAHEEDFKNKVQAFNDECDKRLHAYEVRDRQRRRRDAKRKEREQQAQVQSYLDALPDDDDIAPPGDLTHNPPPDQERYSPQPDDAGKGVPLSYGRIPTSYVHTEDEVGDLPSDIERGTPAPLGNYPVYNPAELGRAQDPKQVAQPVSISLSGE